MTPEEAKKINAQLEKILQSNYLAKKHQVKNLLRFVVEKALAGAPDDEFLERALAKKVYGETFVPGEERPSTVRGHALRLRRALHQFYEKEGKDDEVVIEILPNWYVPTFEFKPAAGSASTPKELNSALVPPEEELQRFTLTGIGWEGEMYAPEDAIPLILGRILEVLRQTSGSLKLKMGPGGRLGSIMVDFLCSNGDYEKILAASRNGGLDEAFGFHVQSVEPALKVDAHLRETRSRALTNCFTSIIDLTSCDASTVTLVVKPIGHPGPVGQARRWQSLDVHLRVSADGRSWRRATSYGIAVDYALTRQSDLEIKLPDPKPVLPFAPPAAQGDPLPALANYKPRLLHIAMGPSFEEWRQPQENMEAIWKMDFGVVTVEEFERLSGRPVWDAELPWGVYIEDIIIPAPRRSVLGPSIPMPAIVTVRAESLLQSSVAVKTNEDDRISERKKRA